jgi:hypothetical protein
LPIFSSIWCFERRLRAGGPSYVPIRAELEVRMRTDRVGGKARAMIVGSGVFAIAVLFGGNAPAQVVPCSACQARLNLHHGAMPANGGCWDDSPLSPELTFWSFKHSQCRQRWYGSACRPVFHHGAREPIIFPPLPYSNRAMSAVESAAPAAQPAPTR